MYKKITTIDKLRLNKLFIFIILLFSLVFPTSQFQAFGDGLTQENLPPASVGDRKASLFIKISPPILTKDTVGDTYLQLRLFDANNNQTIQHTSFFITVTKDDKLLMRNLFHTHSGLLTLKMQPTDLAVNDVVVYGDKEPFQGGWTSTNDQISVKAPVLLNAGLYHFEIEIFGIDNDRNIFVPQDAPRFDSWLSVGDIFNQKVSYQGNSYDLSVTSYYDRIQNFKFDESKKQVSFSMPFNWDVNRLQSQQIFVHEEIHFPNSFKLFTGTNEYEARVNGQLVTGRSLIADPYSIENTLILHYLLSKDFILDLANTVPSSSKSMDFTLSPKASSGEKNSFDIKFDSGAKAVVKYNKNLGAGNDIPFEISFFDPQGKLLKWLYHGYRIEDSNGKTLYEDAGVNTGVTVGILATEGIDTQTFKLPKAGTYKMTLAIFSSGQDNLKTYSGLASGTFTIGEGGKVTTPAEASDVQIPEWIKNNAKWWSEGQIDDKTFAQGLQYLLKEKIIVVPITEKGQAQGSIVIPEWIKNNTKWWSEGQIDDKTFASGIQFLIKEGIISV